MKNKTLGLLGLVCISAAAVGLANINGAYAKAEAVSPFSTFAMTDGASIMIGNTESDSTDKNGMRWQITMDKTEYANLSTSGYTDITFGVLIAPAEGYTLSEENVFGENAIYDWAIKQEDGSYVYSGTKTRIMNLYTSTLGTPDDTAKNYVEFYGGIMNLKDDVEEDGANNLARDFQAIGYVQYTDGETVKYVMVGDEDNVRSMAYVAQMAIADESEDKPADEVKAWLSDYYVAKAPNVKWYVEHYKQRADGTYSDTPDEISEYTGPVSATANAKPTAKAYEGYTLNEMRTEDWTGFVWANGSTHLKLYYENDNMAVKYGDYYASFVQNDFGADAMENIVVDGKLVTIADEAKSVGNVGTNRPQLVISGLEAGCVYTLNLKLTALGEQVFFVPFKAQGASGNDFYFLFNSGTEKTYAISNLVADENGQIAFGSWYGSGSYAWDIEVTPDEAVATYSGYQVRLLKDNAAPVTTTMVSTVNAEGKLVTTINGQLGTKGTRPALEITGLAPYGLYQLSLGVTSTTKTSDTYFYKPYNGSKYPDWFQVWNSNDYSNTGTMKIRADENGRWFYEELFYNAQENTLVWDISITSDPVATYGDYSLWVNPCEVDTTQKGVFVSLNANNQVQLSTGSSFGNDSTVNGESAIYIGGLTAGKSYTIHLAYTVSGIADNDDGTPGTKQQTFYKVRSNKNAGKYQFVSGTKVEDGSSLAGKNIDGFYGNGDYVVKLTGTADAFGYIRFGGLYAGGGQVMTFTGITIV